MPFLDTADAADVLAAAGVPTAAQRRCATADEATAAATEIGLPVVLKLVSTDLVHKSDAGGVLLGLGSEQDVRDGFERLGALANELDLTDWFVLVQEQAAPGEVEVFVGVKRDPTFGPVVLAGTGGRLVELTDDLAMRLCPVDVSEARAMLAGTVAGRVVEGYRGEPLDPDGLAEAIAAVSRIPLDRPEVGEIDVNPLARSRDGRWLAVDARVLVDDQPAAPAVAPHANRVAGVRALLEARSVVIIGASATDASKPGSVVLGYLDRHGFSGDVHLVHPSASEIMGHPCVPSIEQLPDAPLDLVCIAIPAAACAETLERCAQKGIKAAIVVTSGFGEAGDDAGETELAAVAERTGIALCGPNTIGVVSPGDDLYVSFSRALESEDARAGGIALITQSGALGGSLLTQAWERGLGISRFVSVGNQAQLTIADYLDYLAEDAATRVACVVLEQALDGPALLSSLRRMRAAGKPVAVLKTGRSEIGRSAVRSHTGALAGDARVYDAALVAGGAVVVSTLTELLDAGQALELQPLPAGPRVGVVSTSGGGCALLADLCTESGLEVPPLADDERAALIEVLPAFAATQNPVDVTAQVLSQEDLFGRTLHILVASDRLDAIVLLLTTLPDPPAERIAADIAAAVENSPVPIVVAWTIARHLAARGMGVLEDAGIPVFPSIERAVGALAALCRYADGGTIRPETTARRSDHS